MTLSKRIGVLSWLDKDRSGPFQLAWNSSSNRSTERILNERLIISRMTASYLDEALDHILVQSKAADFQTNSSGEQFTAAASLHQIFSGTDMYFYLADINGKVVQPSREIEI
jgi:hypothetical protein